MKKKPISLAEQRLERFCLPFAVLARSVLDLGSGEGRLLRELLKDKTFAEIVGLDISHRALKIAAQKLHPDNLPTTRSWSGTAGMGSDVGLRLS